MSLFFSPAAFPLHGNVIDDPPRNHSSHFALAYGPAGSLEPEKRWKKIAGAVVLRVDAIFRPPSWKSSRPAWQMAGRVSARLVEMTDTIRSFLRGDTTYSVPRTA